MRVALISQFYPPEPLAAANRISAMARAFAQAGDDVHVYTAMPSFPDGVIAPAYRGRRHARRNRRPHHGGARVDLRVRRNPRQPRS